MDSDKSRGDAQRPRLPLVESRMRRPQTALLPALIVAALFIIATGMAQADDGRRPTHDAAHTWSDRAVERDAGSPPAMTGSSVPPSTETKVGASAPSHSEEATEAERGREILEMLILRGALGRNPFAK
jgi:hypothetical protein